MTWAETEQMDLAPLMQQLQMWVHGKCYGCFQWILTRGALYIINNTVPGQELRHSKDKCELLTSHKKYHYGDIVALRKIITQILKWILENFTSSFHVVPNMILRGTFLAEWPRTWTKLILSWFCRTNHIYAIVFDLLYMMRVLLWEYLCWLLLQKHAKFRCPCRCHNEGES